ncbi:MAG: DUF2326 domain-containing protein [Anaerovoracaceae bacterium]
MLCEIICDKFISHGKPRVPIIFHNGLNIVQGHNSGTNSIGKSTFLLIIDFVFGGNTYAKDEKIINRIGHHIVNYRFNFDDNPYFFSRNTATPDEVNICNEDYSVKDKIKTDEYCKKLSELYKIDLFSTSFRTIVGCYFRIYGKNNANEILPLASYAGEGQEDSLISLLKLYNGYRPISQFHLDINEKKKTRTAITEADKYNLIKVITAKKTYLENVTILEDLRNQLIVLAKHGREELLSMDAPQAEKAAECKANYDYLIRRKKQLWNKYYAVKNIADTKRPSTTQDFEELSKFFPTTDIKLLSDIEGFHSKLTTILNDEFKYSMSVTLQAINSLAIEINKAEKLLEEMDVPQRISDATLKAYAEINAKIVDIEKENELFLKKKEIDDEIKNLNKTYEKLFLEQFSAITSAINARMAILNDFIYGSGIASPTLTVSKHNSYEFGTAIDGGTGTNNKNLILLDLATLNLTQLPAIAHDTIVFKHIAQVPMGKIIELYNQSEKQVFIAIDETMKYPPEAQDIIEHNTVLRLSDDGNELFGSSWVKKSSTEN